MISTLRVPHPPFPVDPDKIRTGYPGCPELRNPHRFYFKGQSCGETFDDGHS